MRNWGARLRTDVQLCGWSAAMLENEHLRVTLLAGKGGDVVEFLHKPTDTDFCHFTAMGLRRQDEVRGRPFLDQYEGGWQEIFPHGGAPGEYRGVWSDQHAEVSLLPWDLAVIRDTEDEVALQLRVRCQRSPFVLSRTLALHSGECCLSVTSSVTNVGQVRYPGMWGQHLAFGAPYLLPGTEILFPPGCRGLPHGPGALDPDGGRFFPSTEAPIQGFRAPEPGQPSDILYITGFSEGRYTIRSAQHPVGLEVRWDASLLPYLWLWVESGGGSGYPWFGREYMIGVEPFSSFPTNGLAEAVSNGSALFWDPGETKTLHWSCAVTHTKAVAGDGG